MSFIKYTVTFLTGVYIGQEYGKTIPNVKLYTLELYNQFKNSEFYKKLNEDLKNTNENIKNNK